MKKHCPDCNDEQVFIIINEVERCIFCYWVKSMFKGGETVKRVITYPPTITLTGNIEEDDV